MPRYYFDVQDQAEFCMDDIGIECASPPGIRRTAIDGLLDMAKSGMPDGDHHTIAVKVRDETDRIVFQASLTLDAGWVDDTNEIRR